MFLRDEITIPLIGMRLVLLCVGCLVGWGRLLAQECLPDPGPAIFFEDFGSGPNPGSILPNGTTSYVYGSINTGHYVVRNTTVDLNPGLFHDGLDHTEGDEDGYMVIFNPADGAGIFYQRTFSGLCPNTHYIFSYWVANLSLPGACIGVAEKPNLLLSVIDLTDGSVVDSTSTGQIWYSSFMTWREFSLRFRTGPEQTILHVQLTNKAPSGCGGDLAIDDLSLRLCQVWREQSFDLCELPGGQLIVGDDTYTEPGTYLNTLPVPNSCNDTLLTTTLTGAARVLPPLQLAICEGDTLEIGGRLVTGSTSFVDTLAGPAPDCPRFQPYEITVATRLTAAQTVTLCNGDSLAVGDHWYTSAGTYVDTLSAQAGCDSVVTTTILTGEIAVDLMSAEVGVALGETVQLMGTVNLSNDYSLAWSGPEMLSCADCSDPILAPTLSGAYELVATDLPSGCTDTASVQVILETCEDVFVPTAFSPNGDEVNDRLQVFAEDCFARLVSWRVFDRWGGLVYETTDQPLADNAFTGWDGQVRGQAAATGVYAYQLVLERNDGTYQELRGEVVLVR